MRPRGSICSSTAKQEGTGHTVTITSYDWYGADDLAVAHLSAPVSGYYFTIAPAPPKVGASIIGLVYSLGNPLSFNQGTVSSFATIAGIPYVFMNLLGAEGSSGGPILNLDGQVVALTQRGATSDASSTIRSINLASLASGGAAVCLGVAKHTPNTLCGSIR